MIGWAKRHAMFAALVFLFATMALLHWANQPVG